MFLPAAVCTLALMIPQADLGSMFAETSHDFGSVPHGSVTAHRFVLKNTTGSTVHLSDVRTSCRCAQPTALVNQAPPGGEIVIEVKYDARLFSGPRSMTVTASFDQPVYESVALRVSGVSRQDVIVDPGEIDLGTLARGTKASRQLRIEHAGQTPWAIEKVTAGDGITAVIDNENRQSGRVEYKIAIAINPENPPGEINSFVRVHTNDSATPTLLIPVSAKIQAALVASPTQVQVGTMRMGDKLSKRVIVRGEQPFAIESVSGTPDYMHVSATEGMRTVHLVQVDVEAQQQGNIDVTLKLNTNLESEKTVDIKVAGGVNP